MSKLSILCVITLITSLVDAALGGRRREDLLESGFQVNSVCLEVTKLLQDPSLNCEASAHVRGIPVKDHYALVKPSEMPTTVDNCYPIGSPNLLITLHDRAKTLKAAFTSEGECVLRQGDSFVELLSDTIYVPYTNKIVLQTYSKPDCTLVDDFISLLKQRASTMVAWRLFKQNTVELKYNGKPWNPIYGHVTIAVLDLERAALDYLPPRGLTANHILSSQIHSGDAMRMTGDVSGDFQASLAGFADAVAPDDCLVSILWSRMAIALSPVDSTAGLYLRNRKTTDALLGLFPEFYSIKDYAGIAQHDTYKPFGLTEEELEVKKSNQKAYGYVYSVVNECLRGIPFGTITKISDILDKLNVKKDA